MAKRARSKGAQSKKVVKNYVIGPSDKNVCLQHVVLPSGGCLLRFGGGASGDVTSIELSRGHAYQVRYSTDSATGTCTITVTQKLKPASAAGAARSLTLLSPPPPPPGPDICVCPDSGLSTTCPPGMVPHCSNGTITCVPPSPPTPPPPPPMTLTAAPAPAKTSGTGAAKSARPPAKKAKAKGKRK